MISCLTFTHTVESVNKLLHIIEYPTNLLPLTLESVDILPDTSTQNITSEPAFPGDGFLVNSCGGSTGL